MKKIIIFSVGNINNVGDDLLDLNTEFLINKVSNNYQIKKLNFLESGYNLLKKYPIRVIFSKLLMIITNRIKDSNFKFILENIAMNLKYKKYLEEEIRKVDKIVYAVGMIKYSNQHHSYMFFLINELARKYNVAVFMNAMSVENMNLTDWRCKQLIEAVNISSVKMITTRDTEKELDLLKNYYLKNNSNCKLDVVGDNALWTNEFIKMKENNNKKIGIGLIRTGIYKDYGNKKIDDKYILNLYKDIIQELEKRKIEWSLFCNGMQDDYEVGIKLLKELNLSDDKLMKKPNSPQDFIDILSNFKVVLGARLHCCIISYTYNIPIVGLIWDNKLRSFAKKIDWYDNFIEKENLNAKYIVDKLVEVEDKKYNRILFNKLRNKTLDNMREFLEG